NVAPSGNQKAYEVWKYEIRGKKRKIKSKKENLWLLVSGGAVRIGLYHIENETMHDISFYRLGDGFDLVERIDADSAAWDGSRWVADGAVRRLFADSGSSVETMDKWVLPIEEPPESFAAARKKPEEMNASELKAYIARLEREGLDATRYIVDLHFKYSFPLIALMMAALAVPFGIRTARQAGLAASVGAAVVLGIVAWLVLALFVSLGHSGIFPPVVSAWGMHCIFGAAAVVMWIRMPS
ncbi:MAG TPA: LptF/LptG family permease, partial [Proteobacteria bacterium]|nr:LptF/LptG family permease [Pseudomonadota bacterium]